MQVGRGRAAAAGVVLALLGSAAASCAPAQPELGRFYDQRISWKACAGPDGPKEATAEAAAGMECGRLTVPVDYADPDGGSLTIAVGRFATEAEGARRKGAVVFNFGGPGVSGIDILPGFFRDNGGGIARHYDLVSFDPRGVGRSSPVRCGAQDAAEDLERKLADEGRRAEDFARDVAEGKEYGAACRKETGPLLDHVGSVEASRDLDVLRHVLGEEKLNYFGLSYGTRLGAVYAGQFPQRTGRMVLDAVDTLDLPAERDGLAVAKASEQALDAFIEDCAAREACALGRTPGEVRDLVEEQTARVAARPPKTAAGRPFTALDLRNAIWVALLAQDSWPDLERGLAALAGSGDPEPLAGFNQGMDDILGGGGREALTAVTCMDDPDRPADPASEGAAAQRRLASQAPYFAPMLYGQAASCAGWPPGSTFLREIDRPGAPEILAIGGKVDPATPFVWAEQTARKLGAVLLTYEGVGHGANGSPCVREKINAFYADGTLPDEGTSCPADRPVR
ncbi:alpha/beta fold hydrolase [Streptomyces sp. TRM66268-LWL]|uniref:Alpha/beta fold hydrolase n=1 Tax=Streptomyces polyasparticus TaxID=2767826 RepID=A0ABR7SVV1_9ACTN|nr:alpha/beta hydrolase [Streptomyces polyasparticus]MBC9718737.1 alpha/beta fold hydrolase [Streptomyces polyasparticus]